MIDFCDYCLVKVPAIEAVEVRFPTTNLYGDDLHTLGIVYVCFNHLWLIRYGAPVGDLV